MSGRITRNPWGLAGIAGNIAAVKSSKMAK